MIGLSDASIRPPGSRDERGAAHDSQRPRRPARARDGGSERHREGDGSPVSTNSGNEPGQPQGFDLDAFPIVEMPDAAYRRIMSVNVDGVVFGTRALLPAMFDADRGDIVVTASTAGLGPIPFDPVYGLTKHAVVGFVRSMASALDRLPGHDVGISAICPGFTDTNIITPQLRQYIDDIGREMMAREHVGDVVVWALRERVNGAQWLVLPGVEVAPYEWNPVRPLPEAAT